MASGCCRARGCSASVRGDDGDHHCAQQILSGGAGGAFACRAQRRTVFVQDLDGFWNDPPGIFEIGLGDVFHRLAIDRLPVGIGAMDENGHERSGVLEGGKEGLPVSDAETHSAVEAVGPGQGSSRGAAQPQIRWPRRQNSPP